ncbi:MAG: AAA family ATPase [Planctomycetes bacterium]|nr:AAA family ATPase [Planctomycetota bacterium]
MGRRTGTAAPVRRRTARALRPRKPGAAALKHDDDKFMAEYFGLLFRKHGSLTADQLRQEGIERPMQILRRRLFRAYLARNESIIVRVLQGGQRLVPEPLEPLDPAAAKGTPRSTAAEAAPRAAESSGIDEDYFYFPPETKYVELLIRRKKPILLVGPTGSGKSSLLQRVLARETPGRVYTLSLHGETSQDDLYGTKELCDGSTTFRDGPVLCGMRERRPIVLEEVDAALPEILFCLQAIAGREPITLPMINDGEGRSVVIDPWRPEKTGDRPSEFRVCATANTLGRGDATGLYRGTQVLNAAFLNRFTILNLGYPPAAEERRILMRRTGIDAATAERIVKLADLARAAGRDGRGLVSPVSVRNTIDWASFMAEGGLSAEEAFCLAILEGAVPEDIDPLREMYQRAFSATIDPGLLHGGSGSR